MAKRIIRTPPYRDFLQAALQKRFLSTAVVLLLTAYAEAVLLAPWTSYLWAWFPFGPTGVRTFFLLISGIWVLFLRIGQYHVGTRTANSSFRSLLQNLATFHTAEVFFSYLISTACFWPVFMATRSASSQMHLIQHIGNDRHRLNEKPLFLGSYLVLLAIAQSIVHLWNDQDSLRIGSKKDGKVVNRDDALAQEMARGIPRVLINAGTGSLIMLLVNTIVYHIFLRSTIWTWTLSFTRPFYNMPRTNMTPSSWPLTLTTIIQCSTSGFLLLFMWNLCNVAFTHMIGRDPLKNGKPLTSESKDPNGSLINGLKSKKLSVRSFALWELAHIAMSHADRRKAIFEDIDRKEGAIWSQVYQACIHTLDSITKRIETYNAPASVAVQANAVTPVKPRSFAPVQEGAIFQAPPKDTTIKGELEKAIGHAIASGSQTSTGISPMARRTLETARDKLITKEQQEAMAPEKVAGLFKKIAVRVLENAYIGPFFRETFRQRLTVAVLGSPFAEPSIYINTVTALSGLAVASLTEDKLGKVYLDVGGLIRKFTNLIVDIENFKATFPNHWTDISRQRETPEVDAVLAELRSGLADLLDGFEQYATDLRLSAVDLRLAREAVGGPEMEETS